MRTAAILLLALTMLVAVTAVPAAAYKYYDGQKAADYAYNNAYNKVPGTWRFSGTGSGGDCTNFVSHSLQAGGWEEVGGYYYTSSRAWWYDYPYRYGYSHTWTVADRFRDFLSCSGRAYPVAMSRRMSSLEKGDIVQIDYGRNNDWDHTMIVTGKTSSDLLMSYHSEGNPRYTGVRNKPLQEIINGNSDARFLGWHIRDKY